MEYRELASLANIILNGQATEKDFINYIRWFKAFQKAEESYIEDEQLKEAALLAQIKMRIKSKAKRSRFDLKRRIAAIAAVITLFVGIGICTYVFNNNQQRAIYPSTAKLALKDVLPGSDKAVLFLSDGSKVDLCRFPIGNVTVDGHSRVTKVESGMLSYSTNNTTPTQKTTYNKLVTPIGGQYRIVLPDGTHAWLNASSSIKYPTVFSAKVRRVEVEGEVYFEVKHMSTTPFIVMAKGVQIKVLGTHFDVNTYADDDLIKTTLLKGAVVVRKSDFRKTLVPGQQASVREGENGITVQNVDAEAVISWTKGYLNLQTGNIKVFMAQLARWYNIEIIYKGQIPDCHLAGLINRNTPLSDIMVVLQAAGIDANYKDNTLIISSDSN